jgi:Mor family transcriptional regulator
VNNFGVYEELAGLIGEHAADVLVEHYAGSSLYFPKSLITGRHHGEIREKYGNGASYRDLAVLYGYTERYVRRIIHRKKSITGTKKGLDKAREAVLPF